jgi:hypothetical protein
VLRIEIQVVDRLGQVPRDLQLPLNKGPVDDQFGRDSGELAGSSGFHLPAHRVEVALHFINPNRERIAQTEVF